MAGGAATRFGRRVEKGVLDVGGRTMLERSISALSTSGVDSVAVVVTHRTPETEQLAVMLGEEVLRTSGRGYHEDTLELIDLVGRYVSVNVDLPFVKPSHIAYLIEGARTGSSAAVIPRTKCMMEPDPGSVTASDDGEALVWVGLNVVSDDADTELVVVDDALLSVNVNDDAGWHLADRLARERGI